MPSGPGAVPGFKKPSFRNTFEAVKETDVKLSSNVIREGNTGQEPSLTVKTDKNNYLIAQPWIISYTAISELKTAHTATTNKLFIYIAVK